MRSPLSNLVRSLPKTITVEVDSREKFPLLFPATLRVWHDGALRILAVKTKRTKLDAGDYRIAGFPNCIVERKGSVNELAGNFLNPADAIRQANAFDRLSCACIHPVLLVEETPTSFLRQSLTSPEDVERVVSILFEKVAQYGFQLIMMPKTTNPSSRRLAGAMVVQAMLAWGRPQ